MVRQEIYQDEVEAGSAISKFFNEAQENLGRHAVFDDEIRIRKLTYSDLDNHIVDDAVVQLVFDNRLIAFCFLRKNDGNYNEVTFVKIEKNDA